MTDIATVSSELKVNPSESAVTWEVHSLKAESDVVRLVSEVPPPEEKILPPLLSIAIGEART